MLFLIRSLNYGGAERQLVVLAKALRSSHYPVAVSTFYPGGDLYNELVAADVATISLDKSSRWDVVGFILRLIRLLHRLKPQILHTYLGTANILGALVQPLFPSMKVIWGVRSSNMDLDRYGWADRVLYQIERRLAKAADLIVSNSEAGAQYAATQGFPQKKIVVVPNGIDTRRFVPNQAAGLRTRRAWSIREDVSLIGLIGRLDPMKGHLLFLESAALLGKEWPEVQFVCVGDGPEPYRKNLRETAGHLGIADRVHWIGSVGQIEQVYCACDIVTSCSISEGFPNVIGEAMACAVPCVATDVGDAKEIVGVSELIVSPGQPQDLCAAWTRLLRMEGSQRDNMAKAARARIVDRYSVDTLVSNTMAIFESLRGRTSRGVG